jgi:hypothetical protein
MSPYVAMRVGPGECGATGARNVKVSDQGAAAPPALTLYVYSAPGASPSKRT